MTKAERILELAKTGEYTTRQIADVTACGTSYVRVVTRQRKGSKTGAIDARHYLKKFGGNDIREAFRNRSRFYRRLQAEARAS